MAGGQYKDAYGGYIGDVGSPRNPDFFGGNFEELLARVTQRNRSLYGGLTSNIRESLANAGVLSSGAFPDALANAQIGFGQQLSGDIASLFGQEHGAQQGFDINRALMLLSQDFEKKKADQANKNELLKSLFEGGATIGSAVIK